MNIILDSSRLICYIHESSSLKKSGFKENALFPPDPYYFLVYRVSGHCNILLVIVQYSSGKRILSKKLLMSQARRTVKEPNQELVTAWKPAWANLLECFYSARTDTILEGVIRLISQLPRDVDHTPNKGWIEFIKRWNSNSKPVQTEPRYRSI